MMNQGGITDANSVEHHPADATQTQTSYYAPPGAPAMSWTTHGVDNYPRDSGVPSNSNYHHDQHADATSRNVQGGLNVAPTASNSSAGAANPTQDYSNYAAYPSSDPYGYSSTGYATYYNGYQQQPNQPYAQPVGAYQNTGAPYQPLSSFQNTGSYAGHASYSSTYYNPGDYQTSGGYPSAGYSNQTNLWHEGQYAAYSNHQYQNYAPDSNVAYSSTPAATTSQYQQHYKQWADYYNQTQTEVSCAPGTENVAISNAPTLSCPVPGVTSGYLSSNSQPAAAYTPSRGPESTSSEPPPVQLAPASGNVHDSYWKHWTAANQIQYPSSVQHQVQKPPDISSTYQSSQNQQMSTFPQGSGAQFPVSHQVPPSYQSSLQPVLPTVPQNIPALDTHRVSKLQIPTNPRIAPNLAVGLPKPDKDGSTNTAAGKPAYISVSLPKSNDQISSQATDSMLKPGTFPKSLRGYVERALARCKDDMQMAACQAVMKEVITKATADGTLYTRDWDIEPLFPLPSMGDVHKEDAIFLTPISRSPKPKRSPSRRSKSRWEPVEEEKLVERLSSITHETIKYGNWTKQFSGGKSENKSDTPSVTRFSLSDQKTAYKNSLRPAKKQRLDEAFDAADNGEASSDSEKEQNLTTYYSAAITLADSPEERRRRENRSKRFEKGQVNQSENNHYRSKSAGGGNMNARRATALVLSRNFEDSGSRAVEDIDWDALTVKGTCQEIEKRYLRLTSAPDPATVRPEEVLEKALLMVQTCQKNYLYKCDQLKSIRQDLTVQRIRNELTVKVYETHGRLAIEVGDLAEYNQCQSQLKILYAEGISGCHMEFAAYNLLCVLLHSRNNRDLLSAMSRLSVEARKNDAVKHALAVRAAVTSENYVLFFRLYKTAPNLSTCLMDLYVEKMRYAAVKCMSRSYRPTVPVPYIACVLGFPSTLPAMETNDEKDIDGVEECIEWLKAHGAYLTSDASGEMLLDTKASASNLYIPEPEDAVAHGDSSLAVNDFLTRHPV